MYEIWRVRLFLYPFAGGKRIGEVYYVCATDKDWAVEVAKDAFFSVPRPDGELHVHPRCKGYEEEE